MRTLVLPAILLAAAGCTMTPAETARAASAAAARQDDLAKALSGRIPGKPVDCISQIQARDVKSYGTTLVYGSTNGTLYRSETAGGCEGAGRGDILITVTPSTQLCRGDIARTVQPVARFPTGSCSFGSFTPYDKP